MDILDRHPNPYLARNDFSLLDGEWDFGISKKIDLDEELNDKIVVPFAVETKLSGQNKRISKGDVLHYRRKITIVKKEECKPFLHFDAVDQICDVYLNKKEILHHEGGYLPFEVPLANCLDEENVIDVFVKDDTDSDIFPRGKQLNKNHGIWYTPTSGIWQSIYLEYRPIEYIKSIKIDPDFDNKKAHVSFDFEGELKSVSIKCLFNGEAVDIEETNLSSFELDLSKAFFPWDCASPNLYELEIKANEDVIYSNFALRKFSKENINGHYRFALNNKPIFINGVLDQGYWEESGLTPPSNEALEKDLSLVKSLGFNTIRKHIKIEPLRFYYLASKHGLLIMQDMLNFGSKYNPLFIVLRPFFNFGIDDSKIKNMKKLGMGNNVARENYLSTSKGIIEHLYNAPSIFAWTIFNEGWGQFDSKNVYNLLKQLDPSRLFDVDSGWYDQGVGDFDSRHIYFKKVKMKSKDDRILFLSEFGGYSYRIPNHCFSKKNFGYKFYKDGEKLIKGLDDLYSKQILPLIKEGLAGTIYTQLSDVEEETNGFITYDRKVIKVDLDRTKAIIEKVYEEEI